MRVSRFCGSAAASLLLIGVLGAGAQSSARAAGTADQTSSYTQQLQAGEAALRAGRAEGALTSAEGAVLSDPERWDAYALAGRALLSLRRYEAAADAFSKAIERAPESEQGLLRNLRRQTLLAEAGAGQSSVPAADAAAPSATPPTAAAPVASAIPPGPPPVAPPAAAPPAAPVPVVARRSRGAVLATDAVWVDESMGLMWARPWRYPTPSTGPWNFEQAQSACAQLRLLGYGDWRLPTLPELQRIYLPSSHRWAWSSPSFEPAYGMDEALRRGVWRIGSFTVGGDTFSGNRLLLWSSTPGAEQGTHAAVFFGQRYDVEDSLSVGTHLNGVRSRTPFRAYGVCVRADGALAGR
jgi:hypothetical protein